VLIRRRSFAALVHACGGKLDYHNMKFETLKEQEVNMDIAFRVAEKQLSVRAEKEVCN
jgi:hypothetical protein